MKMVGCVALLTLLAWSNPGTASDWQLTTETDTSYHYLDFDSISVVGAYRKAWVRVAYFPPKSTDDVPPKQYASSKMLHYFDCGSQRSGITQLVRYENPDSSGAVVSTQSIPFAKSILDDVVPDTVGETLLRVACGAPAARAKIKAANKAKSEAFLRSLKEYNPPEHASEAAARRAGDGQ